MSSIFAALDPRGTIYALGRTQDEALALVLKRLDLDRSIMNGSPESYAEWLGGYSFVTMIGTTEGLRAIVKAATETMICRPWCPADLWDSGESAQ